MDWRGGGPQLSSLSSTGVYDFSPGISEEEFSNSFFDELFSLLERKLCTSSEEFGIKPLPALHICNRDQMRTVDQNFCRRNMATLHCRTVYFPVAVVSPFWVREPFFFFL